MKIVVLDGYCENPGDLSWEELGKLGELTVYDRTSLTDEGEVVCIRQYRYALGRVTLEIPAGKFDFIGEDHREAALRELREETGYTPGRMVSIGDLATSPALLTEIIYMYLAEDLTPGECDPDEDEILETLNIPLEEIFNMVSHIVGGAIGIAVCALCVIKSFLNHEKIHTMCRCSLHGPLGICRKH